MEMNRLVYKIAKFRRCLENISPARKTNMQFMKIDLLLAKNCMVVKKKFNQALYLVWKFVLI